MKDIEIYNAVSPNSDGLNDIFYIEYINLIPETQNNTVTIYNRLGRQSF
ncbi:MAG: gliding motility-associated C-terminal domain-containing protein [Cytophagales bacterium]|nr:gliding motility-associated C-terminal domain-containing protein [Cytophagales bacterium]